MNSRILLNIVSPIWRIFKRLIIGLYVEIFPLILSMKSEHISKLFSVYFQTETALIFSLTVIKFD